VCRGAAGGEPERQVRLAETPPRYGQDQILTLGAPHGIA
jgi:hypothetical protein